MPPPTDHVLDLVDAYLHDVLDAAEADYVEDHCRRCRVCKVALAEARKRQTALGALPPCEASEQLIRATLDRIDKDDVRHVGRRKWTIRIVAGALAASLLVLGLTNLYYLNLRPTPYDLELLGQSDLLAG